MLGKKEIHCSIVKLLETVKMEFPRSVQNGWKLQKFHDMLHVSRDMHLFGNPQNWDASPGEHSLIDFAKRPAQRTQKCHEMFIMQVTQWLQETNVLNRASTLLAMQKNDVYWKGNQNNRLNHVFWESLMLLSCIQLVLHLLWFQTKLANTMSSILLW